MGAHPLVALDAGNPCELQHPQHQQLLILVQGILGRSFHPMRHPMRQVRQHHHRLAMVPALVPSHLMMMRLLRSLHNGLSGSWLPRRIGERLSGRGDDPSRSPWGPIFAFPFHRLALARSLVEQSGKLMWQFSTWILSCFDMLPLFQRPSFPLAISRLALVLTASLFLIVVISTIDGMMLQLYVMGSRRICA